MAPPNQDNLPSNHQAEIAVLGAVLANNDTFRRITDILPDPAYFYGTLHQKIWEVIQGQIASNEVADAITCAEYFDAADLGEGVTATDYLQKLASHGTSRNVVDHAKAVLSAHMRRQTIAFADKARDAALDMKPGEKIETLLAGLEAEFEALRPAGIVTGPGYVTMEQAVEKAVERAEAAYLNGGGLVGLSTGLGPLDDALGGLAPSDVIVIAGRPGSGKTALALNIAFRAAEKFYVDAGVVGKEHGVVGFFSLEMSAEQLAARVLADEAQVSGARIRRGKVSEDEITRYVRAPRESRAAVLRSRHFLIDERGGLSIAQVVSRAREWKKRGGLNLVVVDYLQLMRGGGKGREDNRVQEIAAITGGLKALAKELHIPIIALSQVSRDVEKRDDKRPRMSDLRDSGSIEQDADVVLIIYREEYYLKQSIPREGTEEFMRWESAMRAAKGVAEVNIEKQRHGPSKRVVVGFEAEFTRFTDKPADREPEPASAPEREKKAKPWNPPPKALGILQVLRSMTQAVGKEIDGIPRGLKAIPYITFREECAKDQLEPGADEKKAVKLMEDNLPGLRQPPDQSQGFLDRATVGDVPYIFLTARGLKV